MGERRHFLRRHFLRRHFLKSQPQVGGHKRAPRSDPRSHRPGARTRAREEELEEELQGLSTPGQHRQPQLLAAESPAPVLSSPQQPAVRIAESQLSQDDGDSPLQPVSPWLHM